MKGHILLSGGGSGKQTKALDLYFRSLLPDQCKILYIPVAMRHSRKYTFGSCYDFISGIGFKKCSIDMWTDLKFRKLSEIKEYNAVYFGGGNTYSLLDEIRKSNFDKIIKKYVFEGGIVYGGSAGAIILGKDIKTASIGNDSDVNIPNIKDTSGLNFINGLVVHCHHTDKDFPQLMEYCQKNHCSVIALPEPAGAHFHRNKFRIIGKGRAYLVSDSAIKRFNQGNSF